MVNENNTYTVVVEYSFVLTFSNVGCSSQIGATTKFDIVFVFRFISLKDVTAVFDQTGETEYDAPYT